MIQNKYKGLNHISADRLTAKLLILHKPVTYSYMPNP